MLLGYAFWFVLAKMTTPEIIGTVSAVVSMAAIFVTASGLGVAWVTPRFLGKYFSEQKFGDVKVYIKASLLLVTIGITASIAGIFLVQQSFIQTFRIDFNLLIVAMILITSSVIGMLFRSVIIASLRTKILPLINILSSSGKLVLAIVLVLLGGDALGAAIGFTFAPILASILLAFFTLRILKHSKRNVELRVGQCIKSIFPASRAVWISGLISVTGLHLGIIVVFGSQGSSQAGVYFIALSIMTVIGAVMGSLMTIALPVLSRMKDGRKRLTWRITKISLIVTLPLSSIIIFYSKEFMGFFGKSFVDGSSSLEILLLTIIPMALNAAIINLALTYGNYRQVLAIGLSANIPRALLYFILVPIYGGVGAAEAYVIGSIIGLVTSMVIAKKIGIHIFWKDIILILVIPTVIAFVLHYFEINLLFTIPITLILSFMLFFKFRIINRSDIQDSVEILPKNIATPMLHLLNTIGKKLNRSY